jgi:hypothetical protein
MRQTKAIAFLVILAAGVAGCTTGKKAAPATPPGPFADASRALVGQHRLLRFDGKKKTVTVKMQDLAGRSGPCDVAVEVRQASLSPGQAQITADVIGQTRYEGQPREKLGKRSVCRELPTEVTLAITSAGGRTAEALGTEIARVLLSPEAYLQEQGIKFDRPEGPDPKEVGDSVLTAKPEEQRIARAITTPARRLLAVDPVYRSPNRKILQESQVEMVVVVGDDGRIHRPRLITAIGDHEARVVKTLPMWRYEPARRGDEPVAVRLPEKAVLRIY